MKYPFFTPAGQKLTNEQRRTLERVFDVIRENYPEDITKEFIETVAAKF